MGKPASSQSSKKSETSFESNSSKTNMNSRLSLPKTLGKKKRKRTKTKQKIRKLLTKLENDEHANYLTCNSVIALKSIMLPPGSPPVVVADRNHLADNSENCIVINDEDDDLFVKNNGVSPKRASMNKLGNFKCSTPIQQCPSLEQVIWKDHFNIARESNQDPNVTKEINSASFLTIDLTTESLLNQTHRTKNDTVINLANTSDAPDCSIISVSDTMKTIDNDSDVTVVDAVENMDANTFAKGIANLNTLEKNKLLQMIAENIFNGCTISKNIRSLSGIRESVSCATETVEDKFIKQVILGETSSRNSVGSNVYHPESKRSKASGLRMIVIDGSNVAMEHTKGREFSVRGLKICIDYFVRRGHTVKAFVPRFRCKYGKSSNPRLLDELERKGLVIYTPSREIQGRTITPYDDRYIIQCATEFGGVIVTGDNYRDLINENPKWRDVIINRLLPFTWVDDMIMFPKDPLGRNGPTLEVFLRHPSTGGQQ